MYIVLDIETENTGSDIIKDNKRIISIQIGDATNQEIYYDDSKDLRWTLNSGIAKIKSLLSENYIFTGYNFKGFDLRFLKHFLGVEIPKSNVFDLSETNQCQSLRRRRIFSLEDVCKECGIKATHKQKMNKKAESYKKKQDIIEQAQIKAKEKIEIDGWSHEFAFNYVLKKIAGGHAIYDAYKDFVKSENKKNTLFYEYAIDDVIAEYNLLKILNK